jgi:hypothetical protein
MKLIKDKEKFGLMAILLVGMCVIKKEKVQELFEYEAKPKDAMEIIIDKLNREELSPKEREEIFKKGEKIAAERAKLNSKFKSLRANQSQQLTKNF